MTMEERNQFNASAPISSTWSGMMALELIRELNGRCLETLVRLARSSNARNTLSVVELLRDRWREVGVAGLGRMASIPVLLFDLEFQNRDWWYRATDLRSARKGRALKPSESHWKGAADLTRETLTQVRQIVRMYLGAALLLIGMVPAVATQVAALGLDDIERIANRYWGNLRLRWEDTPDYWDRLLMVAEQDDPASMRELHLHSFQLLGGELAIRK